MQQKRKTYSRATVVFPIDITIKYGGNVFQHRINRDEKVKCWRCGKEIVLNKKSVFRYRHPLDIGPKVSCENCGQVTDLAYYTGKGNRVSMKAWDSGLVKTTMEV